MMTEKIEKPEDPDAERRRIQAGRNKVLALALLAFVVLVYAIAIVKISR